MSDIKKIEPEHHYIPSRPEEAGEVVAPIAPSESEELGPKDQMIPSAPGSINKSVKTPQLDAPELDHPSAKAQKKIAVKREVVEKEKKVVNEQQALQEAGMQKMNVEENKNLYAKYPNYLATYFAILFEIQQTTSTSRYDEAQRKMQGEREMFSLGIENADLIKESKDLAAAKELTQAIGAFVNAGAAIYQAASLAKARGEAENQARKNPDGTKTDLQTKIELHDNKIKALETEKSKLAAATDASPQVLINNHKALDEKIAVAQKDLGSAKEEFRREVSTNLRHLTETAQSTSEVMKQTANGVVGVVNALYTLQEGTVEKEKARNEALIQVFRSLTEGSSKSKEDLKSEGDKLFQQITQLSSANVKTLQVSRG
jgi:NAD(P)-dependent dehydrogenase (short-subunit alcohol dehydrogenase family)